MMKVNGNSHQPIRVLVVDDHPVVRDGLRLFLTVTDQFVYLGEAENGEQALRMCAETEPDVVLMDLKMPVMDGIEATRQIRTRFPKTQVIALTSFEDKALIQQAVLAGALGYLLKNANLETLCDAIESAYAGKMAVAPEIMRTLVAESAEAPLGSDLTEREREILKLVADGMTNAAIGARLYISEATARFHVSNILSKLSANNRTEAVRYAIKHGLIE